MAETLSTTGNFSSSVVDAYIKKRILEHGTVKYRFREAASKDRLPAGNGTNIKFIRYKRLALPGNLAEGVAPSPTTLEVETVTGQCKQYGQVVTISDVLELTMWHPVVRKAMDELAEGAARKDDTIIQDALLGGTNIFYAGNLPGTQGIGGSGSRANVANDDVLTTSLLRDIIANLKIGASGIDGGARPYESGLLLGILDRRHMLDLMSDTVWSAMAERQDKSALDKGEILNWSGCKFKANDFGPKFTNNEGEFTGSSAALGGGVYSVSPVPFGVTRTNNKRGFEEAIDDDGSQAISVTEGLTVTVPDTVADVGHTFNVYAPENADTTGSLRRVNSTPLQPGDAQQILTLPTGLVMPEEPATGVSVYTSYIFGADSYSVVDLDSLKTIVTRGADKLDPLDQLRTMGTKWFDTAMILNDAFFVRIEAGSEHA